MNEVFLLKRKLQTNDRHQDVYPVENHIRNLVHSASQSMQNHLSGCIVCCLQFIYQQLTCKQLFPKH